MDETFLNRLQNELDALRQDGLFKNERVLRSPQGARVRVDGRELLNFCANDYLGLANHPDLRAAARAALDERGYGLASVRFICGTQDLHRELEKKLAAFLGVEDAILYGSCFDANGGLFETLLGPEDAIISDALNHASLIDGIRLCKAQRLRYAHNDLADLEKQLVLAKDKRHRLIVTDGVFSMDGRIADLPGLRELAGRHDALLMVDDSHAVGVLGARGRGTPEHCGVEGGVDILTGTFGKALGGACGGYTAGGAAIVEMLRQRSRPYLFSNALPPMVAAAALRALSLAEEATEARKRLAESAGYFRRGLAAAGLRAPDGEHPIVPVMIGSARGAEAMAARLFEEGVYATGFWYPVVPKDTARIRVQLSAAHTREDIDFALSAFARARSAAADAGAGA